MDSTTRPPHGTVAARIQAFQHAQNKQDHTRYSSSTPQPLQESGVTVGRGRRADSNFSSPAGHAARDGPDGVRGDGRPPVGVFQHKLHPSMEETELYLRPRPRYRSRPVTSMDTKLFIPTLDPPIATTGKIGRRRSRSFEGTKNAVSEISQARARLRSVTEIQQSGNKEPRGRSYTLSELGDMIDTAIEENAADVSTSQSAASSDETTTQTSTLRRWQSVRTPRKPNGPDAEPNTRTRSHSQHAAGRSEFSDPNQVEGSHELTNTNRSGSQTKILGSSTSGDISNNNRRALFTAPDTISASLSAAQPYTAHKVSPVRQKAALFEGFYQKPPIIDAVCQAPHDRHIHVKNEWSVVPEHLSTAQTEKKFHKFKFGQTMQKTSSKGLIPLTLPESLSRRSSSRKSSKSSSRGTEDTYKTARQSEDKLDREKNTPNLVNVPKTKSRTASASWPFKWNLFNKGDIAPLQETKCVTVIDQKDEHHPPPRPSLVKSKVQDLLSTARKSDEHERNKRNREIEQLKRRSTWGAGKVIQGELKEHVVDPNTLRVAQLPHLQVPLHVQTEAVKSGLVQKEIVDKFKSEEDLILQDATPSLHDATHGGIPEKEVVQSPREAEQQQHSRSVSPVKSAPNTPVRGRSLNTAPMNTPGRSQYALEQRFALSPGPGRSQSRGSRGRMKVEVEVRDSPEREARERGDKIVIIRADVEAMHVDE